MSTDAHTGETRVEARKVNGLTEGNYYENTGGAHFKNAFQALLAAVGVNPVNAFEGSGDGSAGPSMVDTVGGLAVEGLAVYGASKWVLGKGGGPGLISRAKDKVFGAYHSSRGHVKIQGEGRSAWYSAEDAEKMVDAGLATKTEKGVKLREGMTFDQVESHFSNDRVSWAPSRMPSRTALNNSWPTASNTATTAVTTTPNTVMSESSSNQISTILTPGSENVKFSGEEITGMKNEVSKAMTAVAQAPAPTLATPLMNDIATGFEMAAETEGVPAEKGAALKRVSKALRTAADTGKPVTLNQQTLNQAGLTTDALNEMGLAMNGSTVDVAGTGERVRTNDLQGLNAERQKLDLAEKGLKPVSEAPKTPAAAAEVAEAKRTLAEVIKENPQPVAQAELRDQALKTIATTEDPVKAAKAQEILNKLDNGGVITTKDIDVVGGNSRAYVATTKGKMSNAVDFDATNGARASVQAAKLEREAYIAGVYAAHPAAYRGV